MNYGFIEILTTKINKVIFIYILFLLQVVIIQMNSVDHPSESIHVLHVGKMRMKLCKGKTTVAKEYYSSSMQVSFYQ